MKKLNEKSKIEQFFIIMLMFVALMAMFCLTGCGGCGGCETIKCKSQDKTFGLSIPGCGGILTSGKGCNVPIWPQSIKCVSSKKQWGGNEDESDSDSDDNVTIHNLRACDVRYYGGGCFGCLGCDQDQKSCYQGCAKLKDDTENTKEIFIGTTNVSEQVDNGKELIIGFSNGCVDIKYLDNGGYEMINLRSYESQIGVE